MGSDDYSPYALDAADGNILWTGDTGGKITSTPVICDGVVYVSGNNGSTFAFAPAAGTNAVRANALPPPRASLHPDMRLPITR